MSKQNVRNLRYFIHQLVTSPLKSPGLHLNSTWPRIISRFLFTVYRLLAQNFKMASAEPSAVVSAADVLAVNGADSHQYIDFKGHVVRNYDLQLEDIPRLNHDDPRVESMIANEVSVHSQFRVWCSMNFDKLSNKEVGDNVSLSLYLFNSPMFRINQPSKQKQCPFLLQVLFFVFSKLTGAISLIMGNSHNIILSLQSVQFIFVFDFFCFTVWYKLLSIGRHNNWFNIKYMKLNSK